MLIKKHNKSITWGVNECSKNHEDRKKISSYFVNEQSVHCTTNYRSGENVSWTIDSICIQVCSDAIKIF